MSQVTGKKVAVTPMPTPTGSEGAIINSWNTSDDKTKNAPSMQLVKNDLDTINDKITWKTHVENNAGSLSANVRTFNMPSAWKEAHIVTSYNIGNTSTTDGATPCCIVNILNTQNKYFVRNSASNKNINIKYDNQTNTLTVDMTENGGAVTPSYASIYYR